MVIFGDPVAGEVPRSYTIPEVPGHNCDNPFPNPRTREICGWLPHDDWGDGSRRGGLTWRKAWSQHTRLFLNEHPRCNRCPAWASQSHHRLYRSQGGSDAWENLEPLCQECHEEEHRGVSDEEEVAAAA